MTPDPRQELKTLQARRTTSANPKTRPAEVRRSQAPRCRGREGRDPRSGEPQQVTDQVVGAGPKARKRVEQSPVYKQVEPVYKKRVEPVVKQRVEPVYKQRVEPTVKRVRERI